mgnify:CR=1 FL=1|jgi:phage anti-repressor protein
MNQIIINETINFQTLVTDNTRQSLNFQSKLVNELNSNFTENEQKWYIANLYMYLNYNQTDDYPINLDDVYKMIGFANKGNAKRTLENNFIENEDYKKQNYTKNLLKNDKTHGGNNKETILLNVDTFKNLCMVTKTDKAKEIRKYYVKLENIYNKLINEEYKNYQNELQEKESELIQQKEEFNDTINTLKSEKSLERHNILLQKYGNIGTIVYIIRVKTYENGNYIIKIGESRRGILNRWKQHKSKYEEAVILDCFSVNKSKDFESFLHNHEEIKNNKVKDLLNHENEHELFLIGKDLSYDTLLNIIENNINSYNDINLEYEKLKIEKEKHKLEIEKLNCVEQMYKNIDIKILSELSNNIKTIKSDLDFLKKAVLDLNNQRSTKVTNNFNEPLKTLGPRLQKVNPETLQLVKWYESISECIKENAKENTNIVRSSINKAIVNNTIYNNYRWVLVDRELDPNVIHKITPTKVTKVNNLGYIAKLNKDKTEIVNVYIDRKTASELNGYQSSSSLDEIVKNEKLSNDYYYVLYSKCKEDIKSRFLGSNKPIVLYKDGVGKFDMDGNLVKEYTSKYDCIVNEPFGTKSLNKILYNNLSYENHYYRYLPPKVCI